jgi:hypothetical protein
VILELAGVTPLALLRNYCRLVHLPYKGQTVILRIVMVDVVDGLLTNDEALPAVEWRVPARSN